jgi:rod shape-determining protein MreD
MLLLAFFLATLALLLQMVVLPQISILSYAPFLALSMMRCELKKALWLSALAGMVVDLFSDDPIGLHALNYTLVTGLLFKIKNHFMDDQPLHLSLYTMLISSLSTLLQILLLFLFDRRIPFDRLWILTDLIGMPVADGFYAFIWFATPLFLFDKMKKVWMLFWLKKKKLFRKSP